MCVPPVRKSSHFANSLFRKHLPRARNNLHLPIEQLRPAYDIRDPHTAGGFVDLGGYDQVGRALLTLTGNTVPVEPLPALAPRALDRLGAAPGPSRAATPLPPRAALRAPPYIGKFTVSVHPSPGPETISTFPLNISALLMIFVIPTPFRCRPTSNPTPLSATVSTI